MNIVVAIGARHLRSVDRASPRRVRKFGAGAVREACAKLRAKGARPITLVDDLSMHSVGPWIDDFAYGLAAAAKREGVSIVGGEMAQMRDTYRPGGVSVVVYVAGISEARASARSEEGEK